MPLANLTPEDVAYMIDVLRNEMAGDERHLREAIDSGDVPTIEEYEDYLESDRRILEWLEGQVRGQE